MFKRRSLPAALLCALLLLVSLSCLAEDAGAIYAVPVTDAAGNETNLEAYRGKVLLIVNTATKCGYTPQYEGLEALYERYRDEGFEVLDFPCNQFLFEAPGSIEEINSFCAAKYNTQFTRFAKINVNGAKEAPLYTYLKDKLPGKIGWNFTKFLVGRDGEVLARFESSVAPESIEQAIVEALGD